MKKTCDIVKRFLNKSSKLKSAYTLAEVVVVMLVVAVVVSVSIKITKVKLDNIISYTYYSGYSTLRSVTGQVLADFKSTDNVYMDKEAWLVFPKNFFITLFLNNKVIAETQKKYYCAGEYYGARPTGVDLKSLNNITPWFTYHTSIIYADSPEGLDCPRMMKKLDAVENYLKCTDEEDIVGYSDRTREYWDYSELKYSYSYDSPYHDGKCHSNLYHYVVASYPKRFQCNGRDDYFLYPIEDSLKHWPICVGEVETSTLEPETCVTPSEAEQQVHRCQNQEEWKGEPTCGYVPITCPEGNHWSVNSCGCVPESPTLPRKGINFCRKFVSYTNTKSNSPECTGTAISSTETDFSDKTADITLRNGMRIYNMSQNPQEIGILEGNTQGASYDGVPNINTFGYTVYLDIDGEKGSSTLWEDVYKFYITMAGKVIPAYDENNPNEEVGGNSRRHLMTSVERETIVDGRRQMRWLKKSVTFKEGACTSNYLGASSRYCNGVNLLPDCNDPINPCLMKHVSPVKFF